MPFKTPPRVKNPAGEPRKVGFEFELAAIDIGDCAQLIVDLFGGTACPVHSLETDIKDTNAGTFKVELDARMVKNMAAYLEKETPDDQKSSFDITALKGNLSSWIGSAAEKIVPFEIVTPPLTVEQFSTLETLRQKLQKRKAEGTNAAFVNAFGMHINPEIASEDAGYSLDILRAFLILYPFLKSAMKIDLTRRTLTYIDPFPVDYAKLILASDYIPDWDDFMADYLCYNPSRNRALDLLPLFAHIKPDSLDALNKSDREMIKARPTFHYRLPNCEIDDPDWRIARDWNYWVMIEELAQDKDKLAAMALDYSHFLDKPLSTLSNEWMTTLAEKYGYDAD